MNGELEELARKTAENIVANCPLPPGLTMFLPDYESEDDLRFLSLGPVAYPGAGSLEVWRAVIHHIRESQSSPGGGCRDGHDPRGRISGMARVTWVGRLRRLGGEVHAGGEASGGRARSALILSWLARDQSPPLRGCLDPFYVAYLLHAGTFWEKSGGEILRNSLVRKESQRSDSNRRPAVYETAALTN